MTSTKEHLDFLYKYHQIQSICTQLTKATQSCDHDAIPMSFIQKREMSEAVSNEQNLNQLPPSYMYSVIFKDIILEIDHDDNKSMNTLVNFCRQQNIPETQINLLQSNYYQKSPVWWYSKSMFLHSMLNRALRIARYGKDDNVRIFYSKSSSSTKAIAPRAVVKFPTSVYRLSWPGTQSTGFSESL
ncbi:unnamed protein product [Rotaria socialis]|uniref:Uncharacterized protein n=1 Tax=Rotaria socialis TaxID=392032 RepID=A0A818RJ24_9BILA|nr:unnamed protein product [Rotaria socialis]CAF4793872.1 unnamed protein product [Rotaria socialis]